MLVEPLPHLHLHDARRVVAHQLLHVLEQATQDNEASHGDKGCGQGGEGCALVYDCDDDHTGHGEAGHTSAHGQKAKEGGKKDTQPDAVGVSKKAGIEMHTSATSGSSESSEWDDSMGLCHTWRRSANRGGYSTSSTVSPTEASPGRSTMAYTPK